MDLYPRRQIAFAAIPQLPVVCTQCCNKYHTNDSVYRLMRCVYPQTIYMERILKRLDKLQHTSANLPKEKVLSRIRNYLQLVGRKVDEIVQQHEFRMIPFQTYLGLQQIVSKLKEEQQSEAGPSYLNGSAPDHYPND